MPPYYVRYHSRPHYYGLDLLTPKLFLPIGCILCAIVGLACGSSWTATATIGIAMLGIGAGLGINPAITAGMIISGAYVGDKFSPLSDTTNLAAAVSKTGLFDHVTAMVSTTAPTFVIALILYTILGMVTGSGNYDPTVATELQAALKEGFNLNPLVLLPILVVIAACIIKLPGLVGIALSVASGVLFAVIFQGVGSLAELFSILHYGYSFETTNELANELLNRGGMDHTMWTINLILLAVAYGGALERCGCVEALFGKLKHHLHSVGSLILATLLTSLFCDATMCDQFLGIGVPAPLYEDKYDEMGPEPQHALPYFGGLRHPVGRYVPLDRLRRLSAGRSGYESLRVLPLRVCKPAQPHLRCYHRLHGPQYLLG